MGPVFPPAPRSPALVPGDLGDRRTRGSFPTALFDPCGSSSTSSAARWSVKDRLSSPGSRAGVRSRQAVGSGLLGKPIRPLPSTWRFRDRFDALPFPAFRSAMREHRFPSAVPGRGRSDRLTARHSLHLRFARHVPKNARGVFSDAAAGIAASSISLVFPFCFSSFLHHLQVRFDCFDKTKLRFESESRKRENAPEATKPVNGSGQLWG